MTASLLSVGPSPPPPGPSSDTTSAPKIGPPPGAPRLSFLGSISGGAQLKKVNSDVGDSNAPPPPPSGRASLMSAISGGASQLKRRETAPVTSSSSGGGSMLDALNAQKQKVLS